MRALRIVTAALAAGTILFCHLPAQAAEWASEANACRELSGQAGLDACNRVFLMLPADMPAQLLSEIHRNRGIIYGMMERRDEALYELKLAAKLYPDDPMTQYNLGVAFEETGHDYFALDAYRKAVKLDDKFTLAWANRALAAYRTDRYREAQIAFESVQELDPSYFDSHEEHRKAWEKTMNVHPASVAARREVDLRFTPNFGYFVKKTGMPLKSIFRLLLDTELDIQIYSHIFGTVSFVYGQAAFEAPQDGMRGIASVLFGIKATNKPRASEPLLTFLDRARFWAALGVGPTFVFGSDNSGTLNLQSETVLGLNGGVGFDYFLHPNIALGLQTKLQYVRCSQTDLLFLSIGPSIAGRF